MEIILEKELIKLGFKKKWFGDKSGWWMTKDFTYKDIKMQLYVEIDNKLLLLQVKVGEWFGNKMFINKYYDAIAKYKLTLENVNMLIKKYK